MAQVNEMTIGNNESDPSDFLYLTKNPAGHILYVYGTFNSATATVEVSPDGGTTWIDLVQPTDLSTAYTFTANGTLWLPGGYVRITTDNAGDGSTSITLGAN